VSKAFYNKHVENILYNIIISESSTFFHIIHDHVIMTMTLSELKMINLVLFYLFSFSFIFYFLLLTKNEEDKTEHCHMSQLQSNMLM